MPSLCSVATFPKAGDGPVDDSSIQARLKGLIWLATNGKSLPAGVERVLVMDATDLEDLPLTNDDPTLPPGVVSAPHFRSDSFLLPLSLTRSLFLLSLQI